jgi:hypothetical protein
MNALIKSLIVGILTGGIVYLVLNFAILCNDISVNEIDVCYMIDMTKIFASITSAVTSMILCWLLFGIKFEKKEKPQDKIKKEDIADGIKIEEIKRNRNMKGLESNSFKEFRQMEGLPA